MATWDLREQHTQKQQQLVQQQQQQEQQQEQECGVCQVNPMCTALLVTSNTNMV
jgi:radical SAM protein with 4Fe4S-binding SPASM domain